MAERIRSKLRSFKEGIVAKKNGGIGAFKRRTRPLVNFFARAKRERVWVAKWLFEKLLGSFMISGFVLYGGLVGLHLLQSSFQMVYSIITFLSVLAYVLAVALIPSGKESPISRQLPETATIDEIAQMLESKLHEKGISIDFGTLKSAFADATSHLKTNIEKSSS